MEIQELHIDQLRNISHAQIELGPCFNLFYGANGAGKTSLLEAIYLLAYGRSFRHRLMQRLIQTSGDKLTLFAQLSHALSIGLERTQEGNTVVLINGQRKKSISEISSYLPVQLMTTKSSRYFTEGAKQRRAFLNWGLYYLRSDFFSLWRKNQRALKQRNAVLRSRSPQEQLLVFENEFISTSEFIDQYYCDYMQQLRPILTPLIKEFLPNLALRWCYERGWPKEQSLRAALRENIHRDYQLGYTSLGIHRSDTKIYVDCFLACDYLSQGQLKLVSYALSLAQGILLQQETGQMPIYLIDDLCAELDANRQAMVSCTLAKLRAQVFVTGIQKNDLLRLAKPSLSQSFHVSCGRFYKDCD